MSAFTRSNLILAVILAAFLGPTAFLWPQAKTPAKAPKRAAAPVPAAFRFAGWAYAVPAKKLSGRSLESYLGTRGGLALQYGVKEISVHRFKAAPPSRRTAGKELTLELFRMGSPDDAYGLFSVTRRASEGASSSLPSPNVSGAERAAFVKGDVYVNVLAKACSAAEIGRIAAAVSGRIGRPQAPPPAGIGRLPASGLVPGSERYVRGDIAAGAESPLLNRDIWDFRTGTTRAFTARYSPGDSKLIVVEFAELPEGLKEGVLALFKEYLEDVRQGEDFVVASDIGGGTCLFGSAGKTAALLIGEPDPRAAKERLARALAHSAPPE